MSKQDQSTLYQLNTTQKTPCFSRIHLHIFHLQALNLKNQTEATGESDNTETWTLEELFARCPDLDAVIDLGSFHQ